MKLYQTVYGSLFTETQIKDAVEIVLQKKFDEAADTDVIVRNCCAGICSIYTDDEVTYDLLLKAHQKVLAIKLYKERNPELSILECKNAIEKMIEEAERLEGIHRDTSSYKPGDMEETSSKDDEI